ncbi:MAG: M23 family metallopeptidase [Prevotellaceae bacterium]|nr:M23 family metallopeptidase [Prevotellaceae bacterium]
MAKQYIQKLRSKYRLIIYNDQTYAEVWYMRLSRLNVMSFFGIIGFIIVTTVVLFIAFTPLRELIPGYPTNQTRNDIVSNALRLDSLEQQVQQWTLYNDNISRILSGQKPLDIEGESDTVLTKRYQAIMARNSVEDSIFRRQVEEIEQFNLTATNGNERSDNFSSLHFFPPTQGKITETFDPKENQFGIGITSTSDAVVATLEGTIIAAYWTIDMGYVVQIQHALNVSTVYKNLEKNLKKVGTHVSAGESIGIIGIVKKGKTPKPLIFEVWREGTPINPEQYIIF